MNFLGNMELSLLCEPCDSVRLGGIFVFVFCFLLFIGPSPRD